MRLKTLLCAIVSLILCFHVSNVLGHSGKNSINVTTQLLTKADEAWFKKEFSRSFFKNYDGKVFVITKDEKPIVLGPKDKKDKQAWLDDTAREVFQDYIEQPKEGYKGITILFNGKPVGALLYRLLENGKVLYIAQYFIVPEKQHKGISLAVFLEHLPRLHPDSKRYEVLTRHQNAPAIMLWRKLGFSLGDAKLVEKYGYDPLRYMSGYKVLQ